MTIQFPFGLSFGFGIVVIAAIFLFASIKILREYERGVVFFLGRFHSVKGPGLILIIPGVQQMVRVDLRTRVFDVSTFGWWTRSSPSSRSPTSARPPASSRRRRCAACWASTSSTRCWPSGRS
jgi:regulator of protease activity HflC (stomatin/prohibitin superfamily)